MRYRGISDTHSPRDGGRRDCRARGRVGSAQIRHQDLEGARVGDGLVCQSTCEHPIFCNQSRIAFRASNYSACSLSQLWHIYMCLLDTLLDMMYPSMSDSNAPFFLSSLSHPSHRVSISLLVALSEAVHWLLPFPPAPALMRSPPMTRHLWSMRPSQVAQPDATFLTLGQPEGGDGLQDHDSRIWRTVRRPLNKATTDIQYPDNFIWNPAVNFCMSGDLYGI